MKNEEECLRKIGVSTSFINTKSWEDLVHGDICMGTVQMHDFESAAFLIVFRVAADFAEKRDEEAVHAADL